MANILTQNPMRIDTNMANDYLTTIGATSTTAGLRPIKIVSIRIENPSGTGAVQVIQDGAATPSTIYEADFAAVVSTLIDNTQRLWRNFKVAAIQTGMVIWIERR
jgi:hypothetical protein